MGFHDIESEPNAVFRAKDSPVKYQLVSTFFRKEIHSAKSKTQALTEVFEAEFGSFIENSAPLCKAVSQGVYHKTHRFQV